MLQGLGVLSSTSGVSHSGVRGTDDELGLSHYCDKASFLGGNTRLPDHGASTAVQG
jgi:hypothetical protein